MVDDFDSITLDAFGGSNKYGKVTASPGTHKMAFRPLWDPASAPFGGDG